LMLKEKSFFYLKLFRWFCISYIFCYRLPLIEQSPINILHTLNLIFSESM
jgi:hypothetical protein